MRFKGLDLNLLFALRVLLEELSVSGAAARLNVSQPAMSAALARLREYFGDELFVQVGRRMAPTSFAESLRPMVDDLIQRADSLIGTATAFDPRSSTRRFLLSASDYMTTVLIGPLVRHLAEVAPGVSLGLIPSGPQVHSAFEKGDLDLKIDPEEYIQPKHPAELLLEDEHVVVGCRSNSALEAPVQRAGLMSMRQVAVRFGYGREVSFAERHLASVFPAGLIEITTPSFSSVPGLVVGTQRIAILQKRLAESFRDALPIVVWPLPLDLPPLRMMVQYHSARAGDAGLKWVVQQLRQVARST